MTLTELLAHYKTKVQISRQLEVGVTQPNYWQSIGYIPMSMQLRIERKTNGLFKAREEDGRK